MRPLLPLFALLLPLGASAAEVHVQIRNAKLKRSAQWYAATVGEAAYGAALEVLQTSGDWHKVSAGPAAGWIHKSAVSSKKVKIGRAATVGSRQTSADEVTLAGKGFNKLEKDYRHGGGAGNLEAVDAMEARSVDEAELASFLRKGGLLPRARKKKAPSAEAAEP